MEKQHYKLPTAEQLAQKIVDNHVRSMYQLIRKPKLNEEERKELKRIREIASVLVKIEG